MFEVIGERINTSRKLVQAAVADRDADYIIDDVKKQQEAGRLMKRLTSPPRASESRGMASMGVGPWR